MCRPTELKLDLLSRLHTRRIYLCTVPDVSTVQGWRLNNLESYYCVPCAAVRVLASLSHLVPLYRTHAWRLLAVECSQQQIQHSVLTCTQDVLEGTGYVPHILHHSLARKDDAKDRVDVCHDTNTPSGNRPVQKYNEVASLCTQSLPWCSHTKASSDTTHPKYASCCSGTSS